MAAESVVKSALNTLTGTTADRITLLQAWPAIKLTNFGTTRMSAIVNDALATDPTLDVNNSVTIPAGTTVTVPGGPANTVVQVVGDGNAYAVEGTN